MKTRKQTLYKTINNPIKYGSLSSSRYLMCNQKYLLHSIYNLFWRIEIQEDKKKLQEVSPGGICTLRPATSSLPRSPGRGRTTGRSESFAGWLNSFQGPVEEWVTHVLSSFVRHLSQYIVAHESRCAVPELASLLMLARFVPATMLRMTNIP